MAKQSALELKRGEVRDEILAMKDQILTAKLLSFLGRNSKNLSFGGWLINVVILNLVLVSPWLLIGLVLRENVETIRIWTTIMFGTEAMVIGVVISHILVKNIIVDIANAIIEKITNVDDLLKFLHWLKKSWSLRNIFAIVLSFSMLWVLLGLISMSIALHRFIGFGLFVTVLLVALLAGINFYMIVWIILLTSNLRSYRYDLNVFSPSDSEIINDITEILTQRIYFVTFYFAVMTALSASKLMDPQVRVLFSLPIFLIAWALIITQYFQISSTINKIINKGKWKTLNKIQAKINAIEEKGDLSDKDTAERLLRLADIHKQIIASRSKVLDLKSVSTLFSQLMLPLLGLLLGNFDKIRELLMK